MSRRTDPRESGSHDYADDLADDRSEADLELTRVDRTGTDCPRTGPEEFPRRFADINTDDAEDPRRPGG